VVNLVTVNILHKLFLNKPVAVLPFKCFLGNLIGFKLDNDIIDVSPDHQAVSATFLFVISFLFLRMIMRSLIFEKNTAVPETYFKMTIPGRIFLPEDSKSEWTIADIL
jgi:hypothetical protein